MWRSSSSALAREQEQEFRVTARRNKLLGWWAGSLMGLNEAEADAYARDVVHAEFEGGGDEDVAQHFELSRKSWDQRVRAFAVQVLT